jgi:hypothetical protein
VVREATAGSATGKVDGKVDGMFVDGVCMLEAAVQVVVKVWARYIASVNVWLCGTVLDRAAPYHTICAARHSHTATPIFQTGTAEHIPALCTALRTATSVAILPGSSEPTLTVRLWAAVLRCLRTRRGCGAGAVTVYYCTTLCGGIQQQIYRQCCVGHMPCRCT